MKRLILLPIFIVACGSSASVTTPCVDASVDSMVVDATVVVVHDSGVVLDASQDATKDSSSKDASKDANDSCDDDDDHECHHHW